MQAIKMSHSYVLSLSSDKVVPSTYIYMWEIWTVSQAPQAYSHSVGSHPARLPHFPAAFWRLCYPHTLSSISCFSLIVFHIWLIIYLPLKKNLCFSTMYETKVKLLVKTYKVFTNLINPNLLTSPHTISNLCPPLAGHFWTHHNTQGQATNLCQPVTTSHKDHVHAGALNSHNECSSTQQQVNASTVRGYCSLGEKSPQREYHY